MPDAPLFDNLVPSQIRPEGYPDTYTPSGINAFPFASEEINGGGLNSILYVTWWDDIAFGRPTLMAAVGNDDPNVPNEIGQTVDAWVAREHRFIWMPRDA